MPIRISKKNIITGPLFCTLKSVVVVCNAVGRVGGAPVGRLTLHGGLVALRVVRATHCSYTGWNLAASSQKKMSNTKESGESTLNGENAGSAGA